MSTAVFPTLIGIEYPVKLQPEFNNELQEGFSGKTDAIAYWSSPRYTITLSCSVLRTAAAYQELQSLLGFFNKRQGNFDTFLFDNIDDDSVTGQGIATGDGATAAFQIVRTYGGSIEPILAPNVMSAVYLAGISIPAAGYSAPTNGALSATTAGALGATTYYVKSTWVTNSGETLPAAETNLAVAANKVLNVAAPGSAPAGAIGWNVYVSNTAGGAGNETKQNGATPIALGTPWVEPTSGLVAGASLPAANTTGWSFSQWGSTTPGILTFAANVLTGIAITADFTYYWPVRFQDQTMTFSKFIDKFYENKAIIMRTEK